MANEVRPENQFVTRLLPCIIGAAALALYFATRDGWQSLAGAQLVGVASGWSFQANLTQPLYWLATLPIRLLPGAYIPLGLSLFSAICAGLTLALLSRSVALLPHDRTEGQRLREHSIFSLLTIRSAWLPPLLAAAACGLQLSFLKHATDISTEMLDLLLFAYVIRCLLEFRLQGADSWLLRACFVYGAGMTGNWAMVAFAPLFLTGLIWVKGLSFFNSRFLGRLFFIGSAGLCFYLLLPAVAALTPGSTTGFWPALKANLGQQKTVLAFFIGNKAMLYTGDRPLWVLALPSLVPVLALSVRWPATFGDHSKLGQTLALWVFNVLHAAFLVVCAWVLLDPQFSPRNYMPGLTSYMPFLSLYYLTALSLGYYSGYFLLLFGGAKPMHRIPQPEPAYAPLLNAVVTAGVWALLLFVPLMQVYANYGQLRRDGPLLRKYAELKARALPKGAVVLSDNPLDTILLQYFWTEAGVAKEYLVLDTGSLTNADYHNFLAKRRPGAWEPISAKDGKTLEESQLVALLLKKAETRPVYYLHPSFGYYFEEMYPRSLGGTLKLEPCGTNLTLPPPITSGLIDTNEAFWKEAESGLLKGLASASSDTNRWTWNSEVLARVAQRLGLTRGGSPELPRLVMSCSRALNYWGVQLQRSGRLAAAESYFVRALEVNPENFCADVNLQCNRSLKAGQSPVVKLTPELTDKALRRGNLQVALNFDGPLDEPVACRDVAIVFSESRNHRQAAEEFKRLTELLPDDLFGRIGLAEALMMRNAHREALKVVDEIHARAEAFGLSRSTAGPVLRVELAAHLINGDQARGEQVVQAALEKYAGDENLLSIASHVYLTGGYSSNALKMLNQQLKIRPDDRGALINLGVAWLRLTNYSNALAPLTRVIQMGANSSPESYYRALYNRAVAYDRNQQLALAQHDFEEIQKQAVFSANTAIALNLAELGYRRKDTNLAIRNYELFVQNYDTNAPQASNALARLKELRGAKP